MKLLPFIGIFFVASYTDAEDILVTIPNGTLRGLEVYSLRNISFYAFLQIPFAKPPVGNLRFKAPVAAEKWDGIYNATVSNKICMQNKKLSGYIETEDCLYLNVYTPQHPQQNASLAVMVFIYGGGFVEGLATFNNNGPHYFMEHNVIIVTISYRTGPFGFLTTGDRVLPGNYGLKDQNLALRWVKENIKYFGGNPDQVTIFGVSAGGASVTYHLMSKKSQGLFRAAIAMSGSILSPWAYQRYYKHYGYGLATYLDPHFKTNASSSELLQFLQNVSAAKLKEAHESFKEVTGNVQIIEGFWFTPAIEPEHEDAFITESMYSAIEKGHMNRVPLMIGICSEELIWWGSNLADFNRTAKAYDINASLFVNGNMHINSTTERLKVGKAIHNIYTDNTLEKDMGALIRYFSDTGFSRSIIHHANLQSQFSDVYFYQFSYRGKMPNNKVNIKGCDLVGHGEDQAYLWVSNNSSNLNDNPKKDVLASERYLTLITNFAKTLNPTPEKSDILQDIKWPKVTPNKFSFMNINDTLNVETNPKWNVYKQWVKLYDDMAVKPYDTF